MLVYGDPQFEATLTEVCAQLRETLAQSRGGDLDALRALLIQAGQLEQAVHDDCELAQDEQFASRCQELTDTAAMAFCAAWADGDSELPILSLSSKQEALARYENELTILGNNEAKPLLIKVPEGFEFYALYPEQYAAAALQWAKEHTGAPEKSVLVVGLRSIGTTLSAVVATALRAAGWEVSRRTVRPKGDPYKRNLDIGSLKGISAKWAIIVDEGPGLSGSSLVGAAEALLGAGFDLAHLTIFPGHEGEPGSAASSDIRRCWNSLRKYFVPLQQIRWQGRSLLESLAAKSVEYRKTKPRTGETLPCPVESIDDLSGGLWRHFAYGRTEEWPAVAAQFERVKFRVNMRSGGSVFWKFIGLGALVQASRRGDLPIRQQLLDQAGRQFSPDVLGIYRGFLGQNWLEGRRLTTADATPEMLRYIARYLVATAGAPLDGTENEAAVARLAEMLFWNLKKCFGDKYAGCTYPIAELADQVATLPSYRDGRMAPHEWLYTASGEIYKLDSAGHDFDHTLVGRQTIGWDIAGVMVEWNLDGKNSALLLNEIEALGLRIPALALHFYRQAYAAFRLGQMKLCLAGCPADDPELYRLQRAAEYYAQAAIQ